MFAFSTGVYKALALTRREMSRHLDDILAGGSQDASQRRSEAAAAFDPHTPPFRQAGQVALEGSEALAAVGDTQLAKLATELVHGADGEAFLVRIDTDSDHVPLLDGPVYDEEATAGQPCVELGGAGFYQAMAVVPQGAGDAHFCGHRFFKRDMVSASHSRAPGEP